ncbi:hypothetical protein IP84_00800 [beta proteobacterium AAP99]|nr:hypothetical protein IP84_00800 [beta proteobacterium AAP99]
MENDSTLKRARRKKLSELVMAWAIDDDTDRPIYIGTLPEDRRAGRCRCRCPACGASLTGVNVAREDWVNRPHFRHPNDSGKTDCSVLAARVAALELLRTKGILVLPGRRVSRHFRGLSGADHTGSAELPRERVRVKDAVLIDRARAKLILDGGREVLVILTGETTLTDTPEGGKVVATISMDFSAEELAGMTPDELWDKVQLIGEAGCWLSHWGDAALGELAEAQALKRAELALDWWSGSNDEFADVPSELRRETVLHLEVKRIIEAAQTIMVPDRTVTATLTRTRFAPVPRRTIPGEHLSITNVRLERPIARTVPDVLCTALGRFHGHLDPFAIEVTVTNKIGLERIARLRRSVKACLEIDLSAMSGPINRDELRDLVLRGIKGKRWLVYPDGPIVHQLHLEDEAAEAQRAAQRLAALPPAPPTAAQLAQKAQDAAAEYLAAARAYMQAPAAGTLNRSDSDADASYDVAWDAAVRLAEYGFPFGTEPAMLSSAGLLGTVLSLKEQRPLHADYRSMADLLAAIQQASDLQHTVTILIAYRCYAPNVDPVVRERFEAWADQIRQRWRDRDPLLKRSNRYDKLLALCFPEMESGMERSSKQRAPRRDL